MAEKWDAGVFERTAKCLIFFIRFCSFSANQPRPRAGSRTKAAEGAGENPAEEEERRQKQILNHFNLQRTDIVLCKLKLKYLIGNGKNSLNYQEGGRRILTAVIVLCYVHPLDIS